MLTNYLKIALRNILRHKGYSFINIAGLALGMACCTLILLWVQDEFNFDTFHENGDELCLVAQHARFGDDTRTGMTTAPALVPILAEEYPEIVRATRYNRIGSVAFRFKDQAFYESGRAVDTDFLEMFSFPLLSGDPSLALRNPRSIILTEELARKYFDTDEPMGKIIKVDGQYAYTVTGVIQNAPANSTIQFDFLVSCASLKEFGYSPDYLSSWMNWSTIVYVQLARGADYREVSRKIADRIERATEGVNAELFLQPYTKLHLYGVGVGGGRIVLTVLFTMIALFILAIACMNFMNLATARSANRAREIGMRKVGGATRGHIIVQFYGESFFMVGISLIAAVVIIELLLPVFNNLVGKALTADFIENPVLGLGLIGVAFLTAAVAGFYPALFMSLFNPTKILKGGIGRDSRSSGLRKNLVVLQFVLSVILIVVSVVLFNQVDFLRNMGLGFDKDHLVYFAINGEVRNSCETVKQELLRDPNILHVSPVSRTPLGVYHNGSGWQWNGKDPGTDPLVTYLFSDVDFPETFDIELVRGRYYRKEQAGGTSVSTGEIVINETLARIIGGEDPIGARLSNYGIDLAVVGVIRNFHFKPLNRRVEPLIVFLNRLEPEPTADRYNYMFMRIRPDQPTQTLAHIESVYRKFNPEFPFTPSFFDEAYDRLYSGTQRSGQIIEYAAALAIFISCLGLFGLAAFTAEQRTKEIGVRKVMGASVWRIVGLLSRDFLFRVALANVIGGLSSFMFMTAWLQNFAYRTAIGWEPFVIAGGFTLVVAIISVSFQALKAALTNPVDALRHE